MEPENDILELETTPFEMEDDDLWAEQIEHKPVDYIWVQPEPLPARVLFTREDSFSVFTHGGPNGRMLLSSFKRVSEQLYKLVECRYVTEGDDLSNKARIYIPKSFEGRFAILFPNTPYSFRQYNIRHRLLWCGNVHEIACERCHLLRFLYN